MTRDIPHLVPDSDVLSCRYAVPAGWMDSVSGYRLLFSFHLNRQLSREDTSHILSKINGIGPYRFEDTWAAVERADDCFWRNPLLR